MQFLQQKRACSSPSMEVASKQNPLQIVPLLSTNLQNMKKKPRNSFILFLLKFANFILYTYEYERENNLLFRYSNVKSIYRP